MFFCLNRAVPLGSQATEAARSGTTPQSGSLSSLLRQHRCSVASETPMEGGEGGAHMQMMHSVATVPRRVMRPGLPCKTGSKASQRTRKLQFMKQLGGLCMQRMPLPPQALAELWKPCIAHSICGLCFRLPMACTGGTSQQVLTRPDRGDSMLPFDAGRHSATARSAAALTFMRARPRRPRALLSSASCEPGFINESQGAARLSCTPQSAPRHRRCHCWLCSPRPINVRNACNAKYW